MDYQALLDKYYPATDDGGSSEEQAAEPGLQAMAALRPLLLRHSRQVADRCLLICDRHPELHLDRQFLEEAAMLHDIGVRWCYAPGICCHGTEPYLRHGIIGAELLRCEGWERHARVAERHTGTGLTRRQIESQGLPLPARDFVPESLEEQVVCYADKFYSKSSPDRVRSVAETAESLEKFGHEGVEAFLGWAKLFE